MMKVKPVAKAITLALGLGASAIAYAVPIELFTGEVTKIKFTNYEVVLQGTNEGNNSSLIDAGDKIFGIFNVTSICNLSSSDCASKSAQLGTTELTGTFQLSVVGTGTLPAFVSNTGHLDFAFVDPTDHITAYYDDKTAGVTNPFDPTTIASGLATAGDGTLWANFDSTGFYEGINDTVGSPINFSANRNWMNFAIGGNQTGYAIQQLLYSTAANELPPDHTYGGVAHTDHLVDVYFASRLFFNTSNQWTYRSEDPLYLQAVVPEPTTVALLGLGLLGMGFARRRKA